LTAIGPFSLSGTPIRSLQSHQHSPKSIMERLATGKRINRASDDPAGVVALDAFKVERTVKNKKIESLEEQNLYLGAREGVLSVMSEMMYELQGFVVAAANSDAMGEAEIEGIQIQVQGIMKGLSYIANTATFRGVQIMSGLNAGGLGHAERDVQTTDKDGNAVTIRESYSLKDILQGGGLDLSKGEDLELAQEVVKSAAMGMANERATIGTKINSNDDRISSLMMEAEGLTSEISRIEDTDYAAEISALVRTQVLEQSAMFAAKLGQQSAGSVLTLLQGASAIPMPGGR